MISRASLNPVSAVPVPRVGRPLFLLGAALLLLVLQMLSGTGPVFALLVFTLLIVSYYAVTWAGGLETLFGIAIFYLLLQHVLVSQVAKVLFWEPADAPLRRPLETIGVYVVGMASLALGVRLAQRFRRKKGPLFVAETKPSRLLWMSVLCTILFTIVQVASRTVGTDAQTGGSIQGGALGPLRQLVFLGPLAIATGTAYVIKSSGGRHSIGWVNGSTILIQVAVGILGAVRELTVVPVILYGLTCYVFHYRFRLKHFGVLLLCAYIANFILFPYALIARGIVRTGSFEKNVSLSVSMMVDIMQNPFKYRDQINSIVAKRSRSQRQFDYYNHPSETLGRYTLISVADGIVDAAISQGQTGWETITPGFEASLPRFLNPDKPYLQTGNFLAHREPGLRPAKNDHTTGITVGFFADAFTSFGWLGISVIPCLVIFCLMKIYTALIDARIWGNVLALAFLTQFCWGFSEISVAEIIVGCLVGSLATGTGLAVLYVLVHILDKVTDRVQHAATASIHPRRQALQRILAPSSRVGEPVMTRRIGSPKRIR